MIISESELKKIRHIFSKMIPTFFHPFTCKGPKGLPSREETCKSLVIYKSLHGWIFKDSFFHISCSIDQLSRLSHVFGSQLNRARKGLSRAVGAKSRQSKNS